MPVNPLQHETDKGAHFDVTHRHNLGVLLRLTHKYGTVSRSQLSRDLGLNRSTIHSLIQELSRHNMFRFPGSETKTLPGRPSMMIQINPDFFALGFSLSRNHLVSAEVHLGDPVTVQDAESVPIADQDAEAIVNSIAERVEKVVARNGNTKNLIGVAISVPGEVTQPDGVVTSIDLRWKDFPLKAKLVSRLPNSIHIDVGTEADVGALAEKSFGGAKALSNFVFLTGSNELSAGLVVNGSLLTGKGGRAGRISRLAVGSKPDHGVVEETELVQTAISLDALLEKVKKLGFDSIEDFYASEDDSKKAELQKNVMRAITNLLQSLVALLDVEKIFIELELANYWSEISGRDIEEFNEFIDCEDSLIIRSQVGAEVILLGLGELCFEMLFEKPENYFANNN